MGIYERHKGSCNHFSNDSFRSECFVSRVENLGFTASTVSSRTRLGYDVRLICDFGTLAGSGPARISVTFALYAQTYRKFTINDDIEQRRQLSNS